MIVDGTISAVEQKFETELKKEKSKWSFRGPQMPIIEAKSLYIDFGWDISTIGKTYGTSSYNNITIVNCDFNTFGSDGITFSGCTWTNSDQE